jgi:hypothetical protein
MGGFGSGRTWGCTRPIKEWCLTLNVNRILRKTSKVIGNENLIISSWTWHRDGKPCGYVKYFIEEMMRISLNYQIKDERISQSILLTTTRQPNGGERYWFLCPGKNCRRLCTNLYLPPGGKIFACRKCYNLTYESSNESHQFNFLYLQREITSSTK